MRGRSKKPEPVHVHRYPFDGVPVESLASLRAGWLLRNCVLSATAIIYSQYPKTRHGHAAMRALSILAMAVDLACMASVPGDTSHFDKSN